MYSDEEISTAVELFINQNVQYKFSRVSGTRDLRTTFSDVQRATATAFLLEPRTLPYVMYLSQQRLVATVNSAITSANDLYESIKLVKRKILPVSDASDLIDAQSALQELSTVASNVGDASSVPAYARFKSSTALFLNKYKNNVVSSGAIVSTPSQIRSEAPGKAQVLKGMHTAIKDAVTLVANAKTAYDELNLPATFAASMADQVRLVLGRRSDRIQLGTEAEREAELKDTVLEVLAARGALKQIESNGTSLGDLPITGVGTPYATVDYPATPASILTNAGPFDVRSTSNVLVFYIDNSPFDVTVLLPPSSDTSLLVLRGHVSSPYVFPVNMNLKLTCGTFNKTFPIYAGTIDAHDLADYMNDTMQISDIELHAIVRTEDSKDYVDIITTSSSATVTIQATEPASTVLGYAGVISRQNYFMSALNLFLVLSNNTELAPYLTVSMVGNQVRLTTKGTSLLGSIAVSGNGAGMFSGSPQSSTTQWLRLSKEQTSIQVGDSLVMTSQQGTYAVITASNNVLRLSPEMAHDHPVMVFGDNCTVVSKNNSGASTLLEDLSTWISSQNLDTLYSNLDRLLNDVLVDKNPTYSDINDLLAHLVTIKNGLISLGVNLSKHTMQPVEQVDTVLKTYQQKGCNRAIDLLLACRFADFFGMTIDDASYVGNMSKQLREVARNDMSVDASNRGGVAERVLSSTESTDYDNDLSDSTPATNSSTGF